MRKLRIKRQKKFTGSFATAKVYIEDYDSDELDINDVPCRKLGELKNGERKSFEIGEQAVRVYVITDKASKDYCNDFYQIPAGQDDVYLTGSNKLDLSSGNAFRFDHNDDPEALENRRRGRQKGRKVLLIAIAIALVIILVAAFFIVKGILDRMPKEKVFSGAVMRITLTDEFTAISDQAARNGGFDAIFTSDKVGVMAWKTPYTAQDDLASYTPEQYAADIIAYSGMNSLALKTENDLTWFEYENVGDDGGTYHYTAYVYKTDSAFWVVQFAVLSEQASKYTGQFQKWAKTVTFTE